MGYRPESRLKKDHLGLEPGRQSPPLWGTVVAYCTRRGYCHIKARGYRHAHKWDERLHLVPSIYNY